MKASTNAPPDLELPPPVNDTRTHIRSQGETREAYHFTEIGECVLVGRSVAEDLDSIRAFGWWLVLAGGTVLGMGLGGGWWLTTRAIRPIEEISAAASRISAGNLSERISGTGEGNELGRLVSVLNSTFARLEASFSRQRQFTSDASHELRTPLAVLISEAQTTLARERTTAEYKETVENCLEIAQQLRRLTESLLNLARSDAGQDQLEREAGGPEDSGGGLCGARARAGLEPERIHSNGAAIGMCAGKSRPDGAGHPESAFECDSVQQAGRRDTAENCRGGSGGGPAHQRFRFGDQRRGSATCF
jgi:signal transduction histidine kinase